MELTQEHRCLIEDIVKKNPRFSGNEDLIEDFCSETFKRSYSLVSSITDEKSLEMYLTKVATTAIIDVLKTSGRVRRSKDGYSQVKEAPLSLGKYSLDADEIIFDIEDPSPCIEEKIVKNEEITALRNTVKRIDSENQDKRYLEVFTLRYLNNLKQAEMAKELNISQGEVSKRLSELIKLISNHLS